jgi:hypothetical protein
MHNHSWQVSFFSKTCVAMIVREKNMQIQNEISCAIGWKWMVKMPCFRIWMVDEKWTLIIASTIWQMNSIVVLCKVFQNST